MFQSNSSFEAFLLNFHVMIDNLWRICIACAFNVTSVLLIIRIPAKIKDHMQFLFHLIIFLIVALPTSGIT